MGVRKLCLQLGNQSEVRFTLLDGVTDGTSEAIGIPAAWRVYLTVIYDDGVSAGVVVLESAETEDYGGTWSEEGSSNFSDNATDRIVADGGANWWRARITTPIVGGNVAAIIEADGEH